MAKGIIVVDVPENCEKCQFNKGFNVCKIMQYIKSEKFIYTTDKQIIDGAKPDWCPIHPIPEKMEVCARYPQPDGITASYKIGWNACIDEILKEA